MMTVVRVVIVVFMRRLREMMRLARGPCWVDVHDRAGQERQMGHELAMNVGADQVSPFDRQVRIDGDIHFSKHLMAEPARAHFRDFANAGSVRRGVSNLR